jgi:hypothetical protein
MSKLSNGILLQVLLTLSAGSLYAKPNGVKEPEVLSACYTEARQASDAQGKLRKCRELTLNSAKNASSFADLENHALILMRNDDPAAADSVIERLLKTHPKSACTYPSLVTWLEGKMLEPSRSEKNRRLLDLCGPWSKDSASVFVTLLGSPEARSSFCTYLKKKKAKAPVLAEACSEP